MTRCHIVVRARYTSTRTSSLNKQVPPSLATHSPSIFLNLNFKCEIMTIQKLVKSNTKIKRVSMIRITLVYSTVSPLSFQFISCLRQSRCFRKSFFIIYQALSKNIFYLKWKIYIPKFRHYFFAVRDFEKNFFFKKYVWTYFLYTGTCI